jgi:hypothetical protein
MPHPEVQGQVRKKSHENFLHHLAGSLVQSSVHITCLHHQSSNQFLALVEQTMSFHADQLPSFSKPRFLCAGLILTLLSSCSDTFPAILLHPQRSVSIFQYGWTKLSECFQTKDQILFNCSCDGELIGEVTIHSDKVLYASIFKFLFPGSTGANELIL